MEVKKAQDTIERFKKRITNEMCLNILNAFLHKKQHEVNLMNPNLMRKNIPTKVKRIHMNKDLLAYCEKKIQDLLDKKLIRKSKSF